MGSASVPPEQVAWVAKLSCGHTTGQLRPPRYEAEAEPERHVPNGYGGLATVGAKPAERAPYRFPPEIGAVEWCREHKDGAQVMGVVTDEALPRPNLDWHRAGRPAR